MSPVKLLLITTNLFLCLQLMILLFVPGMRKEWATCRLTAMWLIYVRVWPTQLSFFIFVKDRCMFLVLGDIVQITAPLELQRICHCCFSQSSMKVPEKVEQKY